MNQKRYRSGKTTFHSSTSSSSSLYFVSFSRKKKKKLRDNFGQSIIDGWVQFTRAMYPSHDTLHNINGPEMSERIFEGKRASPVRVNTNRNAKRNEKKSVGGFFWLFERRRKIVSCDRLAIHRPTGDRSVSSGWLLCCRPHHALCAVCALCAGWSPPPHRDADALLATHLVWTPFFFNSIFYAQHYSHLLFLRWSSRVNPITVCYYFVAVFIIRIWRQNKNPTQTHPLNSPNKISPEMNSHQSNGCKAPPGVESHFLAI